MNTPTHSLIALVLLAKKGERKRNIAVFLGSLIPDIAIFLWAPYQSIVNGVKSDELWGELYFQAPMQNLIAWFNSVPIYGVLALIGFLARKFLFGKLLLVFSLAALLHIATDLPVHADDAYRHFWPITDWRYFSPLSYWDSDYHARWVALVEIFIACLCIVFLWRRFPKLWIKITLGVVSIFYGLLIAFIIL